MSVTGLQESIELDSDSDQYFTLLCLMPGGVQQNDQSKFLDRQANVEKFIAELQKCSMIKKEKKKGNTTVRLPNLFFNKILEGQKIIDDVEIVKKTHFNIVEFFVEECWLIFK